MMDNLLIAKCHYQIIMKERSGEGTEKFVQSINCNVRVMSRNTAAVYY